MLLTYILYAYDVVYTALMLTLTTLKSSRINDVEALYDYGTTTGRMYIKIDGELLVINQPYIDKEIVDDWDTVEDMLGVDITQTIMRFATKDKTFRYTSVSPSDMMYYETCMTFKRFRDGMEWYVPFHTPVLKILQV
jgi:hypothetical protein